MKILSSVLSSRFLFIDKSVYSHHRHSNSKMSSNNDDSRPATPARPSTPKVALQRAGSVVQDAAQKAGKTMRSLSIIRKLSQRSKRRPDPPVSPDSMLIHETEA